MNISKILPLLIAVLVASTGCSSTKTTLPYFTDIEETSVGTLPNLDYRPLIQPDDELAISVTSPDPVMTAMYNVPDGNPISRANLGVQTSPRMLTYTIDSKGDLYFPVLGKIHVAGMTVEELRDFLVEEIGKTVKDPHVSVGLSNFTVAVGGEVKNARTIEVNRQRFSILDALAAAGDLTEYGERSNVLLIREDNDERKYIRINLNESDILSSPYYYLQPNDYIYVSPNSVRQENSKYNQNNGYKLSITSTIVSAASVIASLVIALTVK